MAVEKESWLPQIVEGLFADNTFLSKSVNLDEFVNDKTVHVPNAGAGSNVVKNRPDVPAEAKQRKDSDVKFDLDSYTSDPILVKDIEQVQASYNKRESVIAQDRAKLQDAVAEGMIDAWLNGEVKMVETSGKAVVADLPGATGNRKSFCKADVLKVMKTLNKQNLPQEGRYMLLSADMYTQLLNDLTESESNAFLASADAQKGILGKLYSFNIMMRSRVSRTNASKKVKSWSESGAATDLDLSIAWQEGCVGRAKGEPKMFAHEEDPKSYGDIFSFEVLAGGSKMRRDGTGVVGIVQATTA